MPVFKNISPKMVDGLVRNKLGRRVAGHPDQIRIGPESNWLPPTEPAPDDLYADDDDQNTQGETE